MITDRSLIWSAVEATVRTEAEKIAAQETEAAVERIRRRIAEIVGSIVPRVMAEIHLERQEDRLVVEFRKTTEEKR